MTWDESLVMRRPDGSVITGNWREPFCVHSDGTQPASACSLCKDGIALATWKAGWAAYIAENPDSTVAQIAKRLSDTPK